MDAYLRSHGFEVSPGRLIILHHAFEATLDAVRPPDSFPLSEGELRILKDRVAEVLVELVLAWRMNDPQRVAEEAARTLLQRDLAPGSLKTTSERTLLKAR
jgi:hypothetical protein